MSAVPTDLLEIASAALPGVDLDSARLARGQFHDVVVVPSVAAVRIARRAAAAVELPRRIALLRALGRVPLPVEIPQPLGEVVEFAGRTAAALSWLPGRPAASVAPGHIGALLAALRAAPLDGLAPLLGRPHALAGGARWPEIALREAVPLLPAGPRAEALRRIEAEAALRPVPPVLVHGDLGGENLHWSADGSLLGVLDWDLAQPFDQAVDVACLATSYGWDTIAAVVDEDTLARARVRAQLFPVQQLVSALLNDEPPDILDQYVLGVSRALDPRNR